MKDNFSGNSFSKKDTGEAYLSQNMVNSILAHDLKGPVGNMIVLLDLILHEKESIDRNTLFEMLHNLRNSAVSVNGLLENFLFWVKMHDHDYTLRAERVDIPALLKENAGIYVQIAEQKRIDIELDLPAQCFASADGFLLGTVVRNLIYNAIKFTGQGGKIGVSAQYSQGFVEICVADNGVGMEPSEVARLFNPDRKYSTIGTGMEQGSGFGLILSREFIEKSGGTLSVKSSKESGSTFCVNIPGYSG